MPSRIRTIVLGVLVGAFVIGAIWLWRTGAVSPTSVRDWLDDLGAAAPLLFVAVFVLGAFIGLPGMAFVIGGVLAFGPWLGFALGFGGGLLAVTIPFVAARKLGRREGDPWRPKQRHAARAFALLETHPYRGVVVLRLILWFNPPLSYALALSSVTLRTYVSASAVALAPVVAIAATTTHWLA